MCANWRVVVMHKCGLHYYATCTAQQQVRVCISFAWTNVCSLGLICDAAEKHGLPRQCDSCIMASWAGVTLAAVGLCL
jgi:hypothetical protein